MTTRRPLLTAVAAGTVLCALWFVPTADATPEHQPPLHTVVTQRQSPAVDELALADTGGPDTTPYLFGGVAFVAAGGALVTGAVRASRTATRP